MSRELEERLDAIESRFAIDALILTQAAVNMKRMPHMHHWMAYALIAVEVGRPGAADRTERFGRNV